jgi:hypothetical protein
VRDPARNSNPEQRLVATSVIRQAGAQAASGFVRVVSLPDGQVLMKCPMPPSEYQSRDPNARGGLRGVRGVSIYGDRLVIANTERLFVFDSQWAPVSEITHPWMGGVHDILAEADGVWVTCSASDLLIKMSWSGEVLADWEWRADTGLVAQLGLKNMSRVDRSLDYRNPESARDGVRNIGHVNGVARGSGGLLISLGRILSPAALNRAQFKSLLGRVAKGLRLPMRNGSGGGGGIGAIEGSSSAIVRIDGDGKALLCTQILNMRVPNHNVLEVDDWLVYNDTNSGRIVATSTAEPNRVHAVAVPGGPSFARGLAHVDGLKFWVGSQSPLAVYEVELQDDKVLSTVLLDGDANESVYGLCLLPGHFANPPPELKTSGIS